jgi:hypothetical protein
LLERWFGLPLLMEVAKCKVRTSVAECLELRDC